MQECSLELTMITVFMTLIVSLETKRCETKMAEKAMIGKLNFSIERNFGRSLFIKFIAFIQGLREHLLPQHTRQ